MQIAAIAAIQRAWPRAVLYIAGLGLALAGALLVYWALSETRPSGVAAAAGITALAVSLLLIVAEWAMARATTRRNAELAMLHGTIDADDRPCAVVSGDGDTLYANMAFVECFGIELQTTAVADALRRHISGDKDTVSRFERLLKNAAAGETTAAELHMPGPVGSENWIALTVRPLPGSDGCRLWRIEDITERRRMQMNIDEHREQQDALAALARRFQGLFDEAPGGMALLDLNGTITECNRTFTAMTRRERHDAIGTPFPEIIAGGNSADIARRLASVADGGHGGMPVEVELIGHGGMVAALYASRTEDSTGNASGLVLHLVDTTDQKKLEVQFAQSQKMLAVGQLAGGVAHDFNNLLTAMIGFCDLLLLRHRAGDPSFPDIMQVKQNANRAANLVRQLLAFSRQQTLQPRVLNLTDVLADLSNLLRRLIGANIELSMVHGRDLGLVKADPGQIEQVIINLAVNARDAMPGGGTLAIRTSNVAVQGQPAPNRDGLVEGNYVLIEVIDAGEGIPRDIIDRIFEPFFSTKEVGEGTGLGLSTVYGIVKQTGGYVFVDSVPGAGTSFSIYLPVFEGATVADGAEDGKTNGVGADLTGVGTVLLVEDEDPVRLFSARALRNKGYRVLEAKTGDAALELLTANQESVDLLITDVVMPRMDGPTLIGEARNHHPELKVICMSGYTEDSFRQKLEEFKDIHFLPKPFSLEQLAGKVKEVIRVVH